MFQNGVAESLAEECLVPNEDVCRAHLARPEIANKALGLGKGSHSLYSSLQLGTQQIPLRFALRNDKSSNL